MSNEETDLQLSLPNTLVMLPNVQFVNPPMFQIQYQFGLATARLAVDQGAQVVIASSSAEKLALARASLNEKVETAVLNMLQVPDVQRFFDHYSQTIDHLVISNPTSKEGAFLELDIEQARQLFENKFWGAYYVAKYGVSHISK